MPLDTISTAKSHGGTQGVYRHYSRTTDTAMTFAVFTPPQAETGRVPVLWFLSGLTCTHQNAMDKAEYRRLAAELGLMIVLPDTSPRGAGVPDEPDNWQFGSGAGFYLDATQSPYGENYQMYSYVADELPGYLATHFPADMNRQGVMGHSMGGAGALCLALRNPETFRSCSAFAPIAQPTTADWSKPAFDKYLGASSRSQRLYDPTRLIEDGKRFPSSSWTRERRTPSSTPAFGRASWRTRAVMRAFPCGSTCARATTTPTTSSRPSWTTTCAGTPSGCRLETIDRRGT